MEEISYVTNKLLSASLSEPPFGLSKMRKSTSSTFGADSRLPRAVGDLPPMVSSSPPSSLASPSRPIEGSPNSKIPVLLPSRRVSGYKTPSPSPAGVTFPGGAIPNGHLHPYHPSYNHSNDTPTTKKPVINPRRKISNTVLRRHVSTPLKASNATNITSSTFSASFMQATSASKQRANNEAKEIAYKAATTTPATDRQALWQNNASSNASPVKVAKTSPASKSHIFSTLAKPQGPPKAQVSSPQQKTPERKAKSYGELSYKRTNRPVGGPRQSSTAKLTVPKSPVLSTSKRVPQTRVSSCLKSGIPAPRPRSIYGEIKPIKKAPTLPRATSSKMLADIPSYAQPTTTIDKNRELHRRVTQPLKRVSTLEEFRYGLMNHPSTREIVSGRMQALHGGTKPVPRKPQPPGAYLDNSSVNLNVYERGEILRKPQVYFTGLVNCAKPDVKITDFKSNFGFDDAAKNYRAHQGDHIDYRYEILGKLGMGSFGNVLRCRDHASRPGAMVALKVIKNDLAWSLQAVYEIKILKHLNGDPVDVQARKRASISPSFPFTAVSIDQRVQEPAPPTPASILQYIDHFHFRGHMCIVTELLCVNLYQAIEATQFRGFDSSVVRRWTHELLEALSFLHMHGIIHCDLKPENVMVVSPDSFAIKLIDFGSATFANEVSYTYIQSRFYRAPEVILGARYSDKIDIWSLGCLLAELFTADALFPGEDEMDQLGCIMEVFGPPSRATILGLRHELKQKGPIVESKSRRSGESHTPPSTSKLPLYTLFDEQGRFEADLLAKLKSGRRLRVSSKSLEAKIRLKSSGKFPMSNDDKFLDFLHMCLTWDPSARWSAEALLKHPFVSDDEDVAMEDADAFSNDMEFDSTF